MAGEREMHMPSCCIASTIAFAIARLV